MSFCKTTSTDDFKHVCWTDLKNYLNTSNILTFLKTCSESFMYELRKVLGIKDIIIDKNINDKSTNPVQNKVIACNLYNKADKSELSRLAFTGLYKDIKCTPAAIPNPYGLVIIDNNDNSQKYYDGSNAIKIVIPNVAIYTTKLNEVNLSISDILKQISNLQVGISKAALSSEVELEKIKITTIQNKLNNIIAAFTQYDNTSMSEEQRNTFLQTINQ